MDLEAYATGLHWSEVFFCIKTAPSPNDEASTEILVSHRGSWRARMVGLVSSSLTWWKALSWSGPHSRECFLLSSSLSGWVRLARLGENLPNWFVIPINLLSSETLVGAAMSSTAAVLVGSADTPCLLPVWTWAVVDRRNTSHCLRWLLLSLVVPVLYPALNHASPGQAHRQVCQQFDRPHLPDPPAHGSSASGSTQMRYRYQKAICWSNICRMEW